MRDRTVTVSSGGKTFSFTGWKVGWVCGPAPLVAAVRAVKQFLTYVSPAPFQLAVAHGLDAGPRLTDAAVGPLRACRDQFCDGLASLGLDGPRPQATYFTMSDVAAIGEEDAVAFCWSLAERCGVVAVPSAVFYDPPSGPRCSTRPSAGSSPCGPRTRS
jgi:N-succinyldiaminopimelate aminotransferase